MHMNVHVHARSYVHCSYMSVYHMFTHTCVHTCGELSKQRTNHLPGWWEGQGRRCLHWNLLVLSWTESHLHTTGHVVAEFSSAPFRTKRRLCDSSELISFSLSHAGYRKRAQLQEREKEQRMERHGAWGEASAPQNPDKAKTSPGH